MNHRKRLRSVRFTLASLLAINLLANTAFSQQDAAAIPKFDFAAAATEYEILSGKDRSVCEPFHAELLRWTNPVRVAPAGTVFLWHHKGVPQAACCMFAFPNPNMSKDYIVNHEFVSLSTELIEAKSGGTTVWQSKKPGVIWKEVPEGPSVIQTRSGRLAQMRTVAGQFTGVVDKTHEELRMLRQPIYRYPDTMDRDGAIFAFAQATDPEILLWLESDPKAANPTWRFAVARMTMMACSLSHKENTVYSVESCQEGNDESHTYRTLQRVPWKVVEGK